MLDCLGREREPRSNLGVAGDWRRGGRRSTSRPSQAGGVSASVGRGPRGMARAPRSRSRRATFGTIGRAPRRSKAASARRSAASSSPSATARGQPHTGAQARPSAAAPRPIRPPSGGRTESRSERGGRPVRPSATTSSRLTNEPGVAVAHATMQGLHAPRHHVGLGSPTSARGLRPCRAGPGPDAARSGRSASISASSRAELTSGSPRRARTRPSATKAVIG